MVLIDSAKKEEMLIKLNQIDLGPTNYNLRCLNGPFIHKTIHIPLNSTGLVIGSSFQKNSKAKDIKENNEGADSHRDPQSKRDDADGDKEEQKEDQKEEEQKEEEKKHEEEESKEEIKTNMDIQG